MPEKLKNNRSDNRGGSRPNAGRKPEGRTIYGRRVTPTERIKLDKFLSEIRQNNLE